MCLSFLLAFACTVVRVLLLEGKCIASLQEDPAEDSLCLACFYCATTVQGLELDLRFCDWEAGLLLLLHGFSLSTAGPLFEPWAGEILQKGAHRHISSDLYLFPGAGPLFAPWAADILQKGGHRHISSDLCLLDPFLSRERPRCSKKGATATSAPIFQFSWRWTPFWAVRGRDPPQRGASTWRQTRWLQLCFFFCAGKVHCFSVRGSRCRQFMLGLLLLRYYNAKAWTWPPLLWSETGLLLLLIDFSLSTAGPLFAPCAAEILQKGGHRHISSDLDLFSGAGPLFEPWAAEIL